MIALIVAEFNKDVSDRLLAGAIFCCNEKNLQYDVIPVPGSYELPFAAQKCADSKKFEGIVCLGAVIRGETDHYKAVCDGVIYGLQKVTIENRIPVMLGVLMCEKKAQALARSDESKKNKGYECVQSLAALLQNDILRA